MKRFGVVFLSFFLPFAGVVWALEACLHQWNHVDGAAFLSDETHHRSDYSFSNHFDSSHRPAVNLHCPDLRHQIGPMALVSSASRLAPYPGNALLKGSPFSGSVALNKTKDFWLIAFFGQLLSFSFPSGLSYYLFLSVLRI